MIKSTGGYPMATTASITLILIIKSQHASCGLMVTAWLGTSLLVPAPHSLRTANFGPVGPMCQSGGSCVCRAGQWLAIGLHTTQWTAGACLAAAGLMYCEFGCRLASYGAPTALEHCAAGVCPVVSGVKMGPSAYTNDTVPSPGCVLQGLRPW